MEGSILDDLWNAHFVDRRVKSAVQDLFETKDRGLIRLIRSRAPKLTPKEIVDSLRRLDVRIESGAPVFAVQPRPKPGKTTAGSRLKKKRGKTTVAPAKKVGKIRYGVSLRDIISAGLLKPPVKIFRETLGIKLEATILPDGAVEYGGTRYRTCSTAAEHARSKATGRLMNTNGWDFWQFVDETGAKRTLMAVRDYYIKANGGPPHRD